MYDRITKEVIPEATFHQNRYGQALDQAVREDELWLDLGAGKRIHGGWEKPQAELSDRARRLVGCDLQVEGMACNPVLDARVAADGCALPFQSDTFGLVSANMVLEHLDDPLTAFREVFRVLAPGGSFLFVTPNRANPGVRLFSWFLTSELRQQASRVLEGRESDDIFHTDYRANTIPDLTRLAAAARFEIAELEVFSSFPMFRRPALLTLAESLWIRTLLKSPSLHGLGSNLLGRFMKPVAARRMRRPSATPRTRRPARPAHPVRPLSSQAARDDAQPRRSGSPASRKASGTLRMRGKSQPKAP